MIASVAEPPAPPLAAEVPTLQLRPIHRILLLLAALVVLALMTWQGLTTGGSPDPTRGHTTRSDDLVRVALTVQNRQRTQVEPFGPGDRTGRVRVEPSTQQQYRFHSDSARLWRPDEFVQLQLDTNGQPVREHPLGQRSRIEHTMNRREVHGSDLPD